MLLWLGLDSELLSTNSIFTPASTYIPQRNPAESTESGHHQRSKSQEATGGRDRQTERMRSDAKRWLGARRPIHKRTGRNRFARPRSRSQACSVASQSTPSAHRREARPRDLRVVVIAARAFLASRCSCSAAAPAASPPSSPRDTCDAVGHQRRQTRRLSKSFTVVYSKQTAIYCMVQKREEGRKGAERG